MPIPKTAAQVQAEIEALIRRRAPGWKPGDQLPTYHELAPTFGTSVGTIARVIKSLRVSGAIIGVRGQGTYVAERGKE